MVATQPVDFRKGAEGLAALVRERMRTDPFSGEDGQFRWPAIRDGVMRLSAAQLQALLEGLDWRRVHEPRQTAVPATAGAKRLA